MKCTEINAPGNFDCWEPERLQELKRKKISESLGQNLLFENTNIKVWEVVLFPGERLPFRKVSKNYNFTSATDGLAVSRYGNGKIALVHLQKEEAVCMKHNGNESIYDFENIGKNILFLHAMEFKPLVDHTNSFDISSLP